MEIIEEVGPDPFSLRASFRDTWGLPTAIATIGFREFGNTSEAATGHDRRSTIVAQGHAFLRFALTRPGLFRLMWRKAVLDPDDPEHIAATRRAFAIADRVVRGDEAMVASPEDPALAPTIACWSIVLGVVALVNDAPSSRARRERQTRSTYCSTRP